MKRKHWYVAEFMAPANRQDMRGGFMKGWEVGRSKNNNNNKVFCGQCFVSKMYLQGSQKIFDINCNLEVL